MQNRKLIRRVDIFGLAVTQFRRKGLAAQMHVGIVYRAQAKGKLKLLDLASHYNLRCEPVKNRYKCIPCDYFDADELDFYATAAERFWDSNKENGIPFGFQYAGASSFNGQNVFVNKSGAGLTCATFVMAFFSNLGLEIIDVIGWQSRADDSKWQKWIYEEIKNDLSSDQAANMLASIGQAVRYRPEEVAGSFAGFEGDALGFMDAVVMGENLLLEYK